MIDIKLLRENPEKVKEAVAKKNFDVTKIDEILNLDAKKLELLQKVEELRKERNSLGRDAIERGKEIKEQLKTLEPELEEAEKKFKHLFISIPNLPFDDVPIGKNEEENIELKTVGEKPQFNFEPKDHAELGKTLDILDFESGAKVAGAGFYYLKNAGALLELALINYGIKFLSHHGFTPVITPDLAKEKFYMGTGYNPKGDEAQTYKIEDSDLGLIATAEVTIAGYHCDEILENLESPKLYGGYSHCFRQEAGAYGKYSKGLYRVHQFSKVEMFAYTKKEDSADMHQKLLELEEEFWKSLEIPYRVLEMCTGDLGSQAAKKYDLEAWMPGREDWGEITSTSNTTDYQARNLYIRYKQSLRPKGLKQSLPSKDGRNGDETEYAHMLNGTLVATSRAIIAILENYQQEDGSVKIPEVLIPYMGVSEIQIK